MTAHFCLRLSIVRLQKKEIIRFRWQLFHAYMNESVTKILGFAWNNEIGNVHSHTFIDASSGRRTNCRVICWKVFCLQRNWTLEFKSKILLFRLKRYLRKIDCPENCIFRSKNWQSISLWGTRFLSKRARTRKASVRRSHGCGQNCLKIVTVFVAAIVPAAH